MIIYPSKNERPVTVGKLMTADALAASIVSWMHNASLPHKGALAFNPLATRAG